jgi:hypothetical protein
MELDDEERRGNLNPEDGTKDEIATAAAALLLEQAPMLREYFAIHIDGECPAQCQRHSERGKLRERRTPTARVPTRRSLWFGHSSRLDFTNYTLAASSH